MDKGRQATAAVGASSRGTENVLSVGAQAGRGQRRARIRLFGLVLGLILILVGIALVGAAMIHRKSDKHVTASTSKSNLPSYFSSLNSGQQISYYMLHKDYAAVEDIYTGQLKTAKTADAQAQANLGLSSVCSIQQNNQAAYQYALKAYGDEATEQTAATVAAAAADAGDKTTATKYYQIAINLLPKENLPSDQYDYDLRVLQARMQEVNQ
jgi:hypothetical protein